MEALHDVFVPARKGGAWVVEQGRRIRVTDVEGGVIVDLVTFNAANPKERFSQARTKGNLGAFRISTGDHLYTRDNNILLTIVEDTHGVHDLEYGMCSAWVFRNMQTGNYHGDRRPAIGGPLGPPTFGCYEILQEALKDWPIAPEDIPEPFNLFQSVWFDAEAGKLGIEEGRSRPGDYVVFEARMDTLCGLSACPSTGRPFRVQIYGD